MLLPLPDWQEATGRLIPPPPPACPPQGWHTGLQQAPKQPALDKALRKGMGFLCAGVQSPGAPAEGDTKAQSKTFPASGLLPQGQPPTNSSTGSWKEGKMGGSLPLVDPKARAAACSLALERHPVSAQHCSAPASMRSHQIGNQMGPSSKEEARGIRGGALQSKKQLKVWEA